ncbi:MAG: Maf family protein [Desulfomonilaceae bacterium]|jgi:septum formation protein
MLINIDSENKLVLASSSPRRKELLKSIKVPFVVVPAEIDELARDGEEPEAHVQRLAHEKASEISKKYRDSWVLGADTIVVIDGRILGKPHDRAEAVKMLSILSGRTHIVFTGYAIINSCYPEMKIVSYARSEVFIRTLSKAEIQGYVLTGEPMDKAGAYAIQDVGAAIVERVYGSYTNVVGLPLCEVARDFKKLGIFDFLGVD